MGAMGSETRQREVRVIDLADFDARRAEIADQLWDAAVDVGFFQLTNHGIDLATTREAFAMTERFFALPDEVKARHPLKKRLNAGWESRAQVRPSTGTPDQKESYQITRPHMDGLWPGEDALPGFEATMLGFERQAWHGRHARAVVLRDQARLRARVLHPGARPGAQPATRARCACCTTSRSTRPLRDSRACGAPAHTPISTA